MAHRIIVLTDFSNASQKAADFVIKFAAQGDEVLLYHNISHLLNVLPINSKSAVDSYIAEIDDKLRNEQMRINERYPMGHLITKIKLDIGSSSHNLNRIVEQYEPDLMVVGRKKDDKKRANWQLKKYSNLALEAGCPLLIVPEEVSISELHSVVCIQKSDGQENVFHTMLQSIFDLKDGKLNLIFIQSDNERSNSIIAPAKKQSYSKDFAKTKCQKLNLSETNIESAPNDVDADLVLINAQEADFFQKLLDQRLLQKLIERSAKPILILHDHDYQHK